MTMNKTIKLVLNTQFGEIAFVAYKQKLLNCKNVIRSYFINPQLR
jgi:hypothetical protein